MSTPPATETIPNEIPSSPSDPRDTSEERKDKMGSPVSAYAPTSMSELERDFFVPSDAPGTVFHFLARAE